MAREPLSVSLLRRHLKYGRLRIVVGDDGPWDIIAPGGGPEVSLRFSSYGWLRACAIHPEMKIGEAYMEGALQVDRGTLFDFLTLARLNAEGVVASGLSRVIRMWRRVTGAVQVMTGRVSDSRNVRHHYDLDGVLFDRMLDRYGQYSCAYFESEHLSLDEAQLRKMEHLAAKLVLSPNLRVLDVGSGWGGLACYLAEKHPVRVSGITLSSHQLDASRDRAEAAGLSQRVLFDLGNVFDENRRFDRVVSVGMLEHVGRRRIPEYFRKVAEVLDQDGIALIHFIGVFQRPRSVGPWMNRYVFPGAYLPSLSEVLRSVEEARLLVTDVEILRGHYALTLQRWRERLELAHWPDMELQFRRMWEFYLTSSEAMFRLGETIVFQIQLAKKIGSVPITRSYLSGALADSPKGVFERE